MARRKSPLNLTVTERVPDLTPEERARRIERFVDTLAKATDVKGYVGCKCVAENQVEIYLSK